MDCKYLEKFDQKGQENQVNQANLMEEKAKEDKEEDLNVKGSSGGLLEIVQSELLSESIYCTKHILFLLSVY